MHPCRNIPLAVYARAILFACFLGAAPAAAEGGVSARAETFAEGGSISARRVGDHVVIRAVLRTEAFHKETHLVIDYAGAAGLAVHGNVIDTIAFGEGEDAIQILGDGFRLRIDRDDIEQERGSLLSELTARYANSLDNVDAAAIIGWPTLRRFAFNLNLVEGALALRPASDATIAEARQTASAVVAGVHAGADTAYVPLTYNGDRRGWLAFGTSGHHTVVNAALTNVAGATDGGARDIRFGGDDGPGLSGMTALFPQPFVTAKAFATAENAGSKQPPEATDADGARGSAEPLLVRSGLSLWSAYRLEINPLQGYLALTPTMESNYSAADAAFYRAAAANDAAALRAYAAAWPDDRNIKEAADRLFAIGLKAGASVEEQLRAVAFGLSATPKARRMRYVADFAGPLFAGEERDAHTALIVALCREALRHVSRSETPRFRQQLQLMLGDRLLHAGDARGAWKTFLAAAFHGDPRLEGVVRHDLGRAYEALGLHRRAYGSYQRALAAALPPDLKNQAEAGLARLRPHLAPDDRLLATGDADG